MQPNEYDRAAQRAATAPLEYGGNKLKNLTRKAFYALAKKTLTAVARAALKAAVFLLQSLMAIFGLPALAGFLIFVLVAGIYFMLSSPVSATKDLGGLREAGQYGGPILSIYLDTNKNWTEELDKAAVEEYEKYKDKDLEGLDDFQRLQAKRYSLPYSLIMAVERLELFNWNSDYAWKVGLDEWKPRPQEVFDSLKTKYTWQDSEIEYTGTYTYSYSYSYKWDEEIPAQYDAQGNLISPAHTVTHTESGGENNIEVVVKRLFKVKLLKQAEAFDNTYVFEYGDYVTEDAQVSGGFNYGNDTLELSDPNNVQGETLDVLATAYCPGTPESGCPVDERGYAQCTGSNRTGITATGIKAKQGNGTLASPHMIAVDPEVIPLKSLVYIDGMGYALAVDTGSAIKGNRIDILFDYHKDAERFGVKPMRVTVLKPGSSYQLPSGAVQSGYDNYDDVLLPEGIGGAMTEDAEAKRNAIRSSFRSDAYDIKFDFSFEIKGATKRYQPLQGITTTTPPFQRLINYLEARFNQKINMQDLETVLYAAAEYDEDFAYNLDANGGFSYFKENPNLQYNLPFQPGGLGWPTLQGDAIYFTSLFGPRWGEFHTGVDIGSYQRNIPIMAAGDGIVTFAGINGSLYKGYGRFIKIDHGLNEEGQRILTLYGHLEKIYVRVGQEVKKGDIIGLMGSTGRSSGIHLHFEIRVNGKWVNPLSFFPPDFVHSIPIH